MAIIVACINGFVVKHRSSNMLVFFCPMVLMIGEVYKNITTMYRAYIIRSQLTRVILHPVTRFSMFLQPCGSGCKRPDSRWTRLLYRTVLKCIILLLLEMVQPTSCDQWSPKSLYVFHYFATMAIIV